ncbi:ABC transporter ATP-binding protein [Spiroplasma alleghenense]|uniref:ABC transporter ATP-binding protein n=1 Tax=Spiroplasma alleghenense TaxID=216931 RepID=A0A345Z4L0_9MOLU|nr:ABC transporter ATP-binding protein [Spiroplasma alleghenense]AXK51539.1 ABC transporter ATP-binding protein [Spiroplasma alleghenense]
MNLQLKNVEKSINKKPILKNISFELNEGEIIGFIGDNGAGKTTTIKSIFQEYQIQHGEILINDQKIDNNILKKIEFFPDQNNFPKNYKVRDYCYYNYKLSKEVVNKDEFNKLFEKTMTALNLQEQLNAKFSQLSSGMQKKALMVMVLLTKPEILILDEPTANLDVESRLEFNEILKMLSKDLKINILITSHNIEELETLITKIVLIKDGEIILSKKFDKTKEKLADIYAKHYNRPSRSLVSGKLEEILKNEK